MKIAVVGAGLMGAPIGAEYALGGHDVVLVASSAASSAAAVSRAHDAIGTLEQEGLADTARASAGRGRIAAAPLARACEGADLIVESLPEDLARKGDVLREALGAAPATAIVASNTSSIPIDAIGEACGAAPRVVGAHYFNPPHLMPLVEVIAGPRTLGSAVETVASALRGIGKQPVFARDVPGFLWNRLQFALLHEAARIVDEQVATPEDVDLAVRRGLARRWSLVGPFETMALGGAATFAAIAARLFPEVERPVDAAALARVRLPAVGPETRAQRDRLLARLLRDGR
ncbi:MAG TPA: 3-hydroxyacyl-CoA dehydrogenase family protein [Candidatus Limnocylindria bacterium]|nr:3-hydroxyacyl-CoA dehydrogenase family protein [Candidatus Limnocylindria bacterium]